MSIFTKLGRVVKAVKSQSQQKLGKKMTDFSDESRVFLGRPIHTSNRRMRHRGWHWAEKFSKFEPPDTLKTHSLAVCPLKKTIHIRNCMAVRF